MLCSSKNNKRPDKLLQKRLVSLAYALVVLTVIIMLFLFYPAYFLPLIGATVIMTTICLSLTIKTLDAGEQAISYGGFANEIIRNDFKIKRIDNSAGHPVLENDPARDLFKGLPILGFLEEHLADSSANKAAFYRLQTACSNLSRETVQLSLILRRDDSKIFNDEEWFEISVQPIFLKKTDIFEGPFSIRAIKKDTYLFWSADNITAQKNMEQLFRQEHKSLHDFMDHLPAGLYIAAKDYTLEYANNAFSELLGLSHEEVLGRSLGSLLSNNTPLPPRHSLWQGELHFKNAAHDSIEAYVFQQSFREDDELKTRGVVITGLPSEKELQQKLDHSCDQISWLFNNAPVGIVFTDTEGLIKDANASACTFLGLPRDKLFNRPIFNCIKAEDSVSLKNDFANINAERQTTQHLEVHLSGENGEKVAAIYISPMQKFYAADASNIDGMVLYLIDATRQKSLEQQFAQAQKMQAVGQLAGGVAHDFNNLLTAMIGFCDLLLQRHGVGDPSFADLIQIKQNANRAAGLVRQLLAFSRKQPLKPKLIDITENFAELSHMLKRILGEQITLKFRHGKDLGYIKVDPVQFSQVIINLAVNAKDAMEGSGTLTISTRVDVLSENYRFGDDVVKPGEFVVIDVTDTGCGIPAENLIRIFDPFFSTKQNVVGSGTGLGLAMVYGIVRQTEGFIKVDSTVGVGTTFSVYLPRFDSNIDEAAAPHPEKEVVTNQDGTPILSVQEKIKAPTAVSEKLIFGLNLSTIDRTPAKNGKDPSQTRILFVEDEDSVRTFAVRALKKKGYDVVACNSGENALKHLEQDLKFDLLITDMVMPGISGAELIARVKELLPAVKVILASGYSEEMVRQELKNAADFEFITKPFSLGDLTSRVFDVLNKD